MTSTTPTTMRVVDATGNGDGDGGEGSMVES
jgi:hypothetical protein